MDDLDALLADLQNSVPGYQSPTLSVPHQNGSSGGYGSLRAKPQPEPYQQKTVSSSTQQSIPIPVYNGNSSPTVDNYQYGSVGKSKPALHSQQSNGSGVSAGGNLSELDSLLQDLSSSRYRNPGELDSNAYSNGGKNRPTMDSLLDELSNATANQSYNIPNGTSTPYPAGKQPGKQVTITVKETKTERVTGSPPRGIIPAGSRLEKTTTTSEQTAVGRTPYASSATKELDDLMASLSDFQVNSSSHRVQTVTDYAKPNKGISHTQSTTVTEAFEQRDQLDSMLGNLQANMNRQGINTTQKGCCNACDKPIVGQVITALGKTWHPEHFVCNHCNQELGTRNFFERDGYPYCEPDYHNLFSPRCAYCNGAILDKCVTALDKTWHTEHFFCAQCGQQFGEDGFHERDGKPYCRNDYFDMFAPKCNGCMRPIMENYISALNAQWHADCFVCRDCRQQFQGGSFFDHEGLPYCETHYHAKRGSLCAGCSKPITGRCITAMFKKFHPEHFVCAFCLKQLNKGTFKEQKDKPYCHECFDKLYG